MPPTAATTGSRAARTLESSPTASSRLTSRPMTRKKMAMSPSLTRSRTVSSSCQSPISSVTGVVQKSS